MPFARIVAAAAALLLVAALPASAATKRRKVVTYRTVLKVDGRTVAGPFASTETVTGDLVNDPAGSAVPPTAWTAEGPLTFGPIANTGLPAGCTLSTPSPTGTWKTALTRAGSGLEVNWSTNSTQPGGGVITCMGFSAPFSGSAPAQPLSFLEPHQFTISAEGGTQQIKGRFDGGGGMMENTGTLTVTKREECEPKVKQVITSPPGQTTELSTMAGKGFVPGEKLTADRNVEFEFSDGSIMRLAKGSSYKETADCGSMQDTSKSYKGTLLLGLVWMHVTKIFGNQQSYEPQCPERCIVGVRGTTLWVRGSKTAARVSVGKGSVWFSRLTRAGRLKGPKVIVRAGQTAVMVRGGRITKHRTRSSELFEFKPI